ncbi:hypothetical protein [Bradyrhizobium sp.]|uniref:hypothetical protein n=1 Tax=Bradyrhizobium sp. TaxID=376 RepID=UPI002E02BDA2|nr:hypothetical protein [Bradyrhizobium sp.]
MILEQAQLLAEIVAVVAGSIAGCNALYNKIMNDLQRRKLLRIEVEREKIALTREEMILIGEYNKLMADMLQLGTPASIDARTEKPLVSLKILLSVYRRIRILADYRIKRKALLPTKREQTSQPPRLPDLR